MRQFLFDAFHIDLLQALAGSTDTRLAEIAAKSIKEVSYHLERTTDMVIRLGDGTKESHARMQAALDDQWSYAGEFFVSDASDKAVAAAGIAPDPADLRAGWLARITPVLEEATLQMPTGTFVHKGGKQGRHTEHLGFILADMQFLQRAYPNSVW
jgi:ring-1,2-phenylacetyl-CoA epoxidase subunit PaaC